MDGNAKEGKTRQNKATRPRKPTTSPRPSRRKQNVPMDQRLTIDVKEAAAYIGISLQTAYAEIRENRLPIVKIRGRILVVRKLLEEMMLEEGRKGWVRD